MCEECEECGELIYKLIMPAHMIPPEAVITKKTGAKEYRLRKKIVVYDGAGDKRTIEPYGDALFIVSEDGNANAISADTELVWLVDKYTLKSYLDYETPQ